MLRCVGFGTPRKSFHITATEPPDATPSSRDQLSALFFKSKLYWVMLVVHCNTKTPFTPTLPRSLPNIGKSNFILARSWTAPRLYPTGSIEQFYPVELNQKKTAAITEEKIKYFINSRTQI